MVDFSRIAIDTVPLPDSAADIRTVHVRVPAKVAFNLGSMQKVTASILDRLGHSSCHSGWDIRFDIESRFLVDEKLQVREAF
jgi:hypothetical protein